MLPNVSKMWRKWYEEFKVSYPDFKFLTENVKFEEVRVESQEDAVFKALGKTIYQEKRGPTMLCYQTDKDSCPIKSKYYLSSTWKKYVFGWMSHPTYVISLSPSQMIRVLSMVLI